MLESLRYKIAQTIVERQGVTSDRVARTFIYLASPSLLPVKEWYEENFREIDHDAQFLRPWLISQSDRGEFTAKMNDAVRTTYDIVRIGKLVMKGTTIADSLNQVLVVADLTENGAEKRVIAECQAIAHALQQFTSAEAPLFWTGIFIIGRLISSEKVEQSKIAPETKVDSELLHAGKDSVESIIQELSPDLFGRIFLLDVSNPRGILISRECDKFSILGQLLYFLMTFPLSTGALGDYANWVNANPSLEKYVTGFSSISFVLPIEKILEAVTVVRGAEVMEEGLLTVLNEDRFRLYLASFLNQNYLSQAESLQAALSSDKELPLKDPIAAFPGFDEMPLDDYLETVSIIDASLPQTTQENCEIMKKIAECCLQESRLSLDDHLDGMTGGEQGGLLMAGRLLTELHAHLKNVAPKEKMQPKFDDPKGEIQNLQLLAEKSPRKRAIYARGLILTLSCLLAVMILPLSLLLKPILLIVLPALCILLTLFVYISSQQELKNHVVNLHTLLRKKLEELMKTDREEAINKHIAALQRDIEADQELMKAAIDRVKTVLDYFRKEYSPEMPQELGFWKYVVTAGQFKNYYPLCRAKISDVARDYINIERPLSPWRRLVAHHDAVPEPWEYGLIEKAGLRLLPDCGDIFNLTVQSHFHSSQPQFHGYKELVIRAANPFLIVNPMRHETGMLNTYLMLESGSEGECPALNSFINDLSQAFTVHGFGKARPYRFSIFGFLEGVSVIDVDLK